jgi:hypothetical protein
MIILWLCNPNNPTGTYFSHDELESFLERVPSHVPVLILLKFLPNQIRHFLTVLLQL